MCSGETMIKQTEMDRLRILYNQTQGNLDTLRLTQDKD